MSNSKKLRKYLKAMNKAGASDLHLRVGSKPIFRIEGTLRQGKNFEKLSSEDIRKMAQEMFETENFEEFEKKNEVDLSYSAPGLSRYRVNVFQQRGNVNIVMRLVPPQVETIENLNLPVSLKKIASNSRGMVLVTGTTGSGKTTTIASMIDYINRNFSKHIITLEDPIEYIHRDIKSIISQRELGIDTYSYPEALRNIVRQDPDVIFIGEMRDSETIEAALRAAQMGHLVFSTLHTVNAMQTISRIVEVFPPHQQNKILLRLADSLTAVISQRLLPWKGKRGMIPAVEMLVITSLIQSLIEEENFSKIPKQMAKGDYYGMQNFNQALEKLYNEEKITLEAAKKASTNPEDLMLKIRGIQSDSGATD
ncbi:MAG: type IV pilus twitching motility protein PilT [Elusimicrobiota bacterium]